MHDSIPADAVKLWKRELGITQDMPKNDPRVIEVYRRLAECEDAGHGACHLRDPRIAVLVQNALLYFDAQRYRLLEWCVMPNHVHALIATMEGHPVPEILHFWKSYTALEAGKILRHVGAFWMEDYFDHCIRNEEHLAHARRYIRENPVKVGLCKAAGDWQWGSVRRV